jgi:hypothetical protein
MTFQTDSHLLFHEELDEVLPRLVAKITELAVPPRISRAPDIVPGHEA